MLAHLKTHRAQYVVDFIALAAAFYHLKTAFLGAPTALIHRPIHLTFMLLLLYLTYTFKGKKETITLGLNSAIYSVILLTILIFTLANYEWFMTRFEFVEPLKTSEIIIGVLLILMVLEASRRSSGPQLPVLAIIFLVYGFLGNHLPKGLLWHRGLALSEVVEVSYMSLSGIWSTPIYATSTYVFIFTLFASFLLKTGVGNFFNDFALSVTRNTTGGPAKSAVVASGFMGMISGISTANVVATGSFTIPMMIRSGYSPLYAGAVEAVASTGGQILPPVMGVAAFIMAEFTGIPYVEIVKRAAFPAILYFLSVFMMVHFRAHKKDITQSQTIELRTIELLIDKGHLFLPLLVILVFLIKGFTPQLASFYGILATIVVVTVKKSTRPTLKTIYAALVDGAKMVIPVAAVCACAGIVIGIVSLTGLGFRMTQLVIYASGGNSFVALILTMITAIILGMGLPTSAAYIIMATLLAPALVDMGISLIAAHLFVLYFACLSSITPPVALAAYAAAGLSGASPMKTGFMAWRIGLTAFIVPFMFVYGTSLLMIGDPLKIIISIITSVLGVTVVASAIEGWLYSDLSTLTRIVLFFSGISLVFPHISTNIIGILLVTLIFVRHRAKSAQKLCE